MATAQILQRQLQRTPFSVIYVPKGPTLDYDDTQLLAKVLVALEQQADRQHTLFAKIDPNVWLGFGTKVSFPSPRATAVLKILAKRGWRQSAEQIQFKNTHIIDLSADEDKLMADMKAKTRYNVRLSKRRGVHIRLGGESDLKTFYQLYNETSQRNAFLIRPPAYYLDIWTQTLRAGRGHLLLAEVDGNPIAGLIMFHFKKTAWYMYGASSNQHRNLMPNFLLQWEAMRLAKQNGCTKYDMWGAPDRFDDSDPLWGVFRFKTGFGGQTMQGLGAFDYAPTPWLYWIYTTAMPRALALMRRRHRAKL
jgi:lipid II:glycine glycyltransferase (peptidoglycan interpeptide bridge formation enzyme)